MREAEYRIVDLKDLHPAPYNPRFDLQDGDINLENLRASIEKNGLVQPIVWTTISLIEIVIALK